MRWYWLYFILFWLCFIAIDSAFSQSEVPCKYFAPDDLHTIEIVPTALPHAGPGNDATLVVRARDTVLARYPTRDVPLVDLWSPNGKFVVAAQHDLGRADYLWVFRLADGKALKKPEFLKPVPRQPVYSAQVLVARVLAKFPEYRHASWVGSGATTNGWTTHNELIIQAVVCFREVSDYVEITDTYRVSAKGLHLNHSEMRKTHS